MPGGDKIFKAIETSKMQDHFNTKPMIVKLKDTYKALGKGIISLMADNYELQDLTFKQNNKVSSIKIVGENYFKSSPTEMSKHRSNELVIIKNNYPVDVRITEGLDFTESSIQNQLLELAKTDIPTAPVNQVLLKAYFESVDQGPLLEDIEQAQKEMANQPPQPNEAQPPKPPGMPPPPEAPQKSAGTPEGVNPLLSHLLAGGPPPGGMNVPETGIGPLAQPRPQDPLEATRNILQSGASLQPDGTEPQGGPTGMGVSPKPGTIPPALVEAMKQLGGAP